MKRILTIIIFMLCFTSINVYADTTFSRGIIANGSSAVYREANNNNRQTTDLGVNVTLSSPESVTILGEENGYYKIKYQYSAFIYTGYTLKSNVTNVSVVNVPDSLVNEYVNQGLSRDYALEVAKLKTLHPNWNFEIYKVNKDFNTVVNGEARVLDNNLIDSANTTLRSTDDGAYSNGVWTQFSGGSWYAASKQTIAYFLDPRNFLNENHIFMYEKLFQVCNGDGSCAQDANVVSSILAGTFMDVNYTAKDSLGLPYYVTPFYYVDANKLYDKAYGQIFLEAANNSSSKISAVHLASRVLQEQGKKGSYTADGTGQNNKYPDLVGYFNFYNISASGNANGTVIKRGLEAAKSFNWNSPYAAIVGGADKIAAWYIIPGQNNLFLQKFDMDSYDHQYMQNIKAPYSESYTTYKAYYNNNKMEYAYTFRLPVYNNMPEFTSLDASYNEDNTLSSLSIPGCSLMPSFTSSATYYTCNVPADTTKLNVSATSTSPVATVTGTGEVLLTSNETSLSVNVKSANGNDRTYTIRVNKVDYGSFTPDDILSKLGINNDQEFISGFDLGTSSNAIPDMIRNNYPSVSSSVSENSIVKTGMKLNITNNGSKAYTFVVYGDNNGDGVIDIIDLLKVQKHILGSTTLNGAYYKASDVNKDNNIDIIDLLKIQKSILGVGNIDQ